MLKQRVITAVILIPLFILFLFKSTPIVFCIVTGLLTLWAAFEWSFLMGIKHFPACVGYPFFILLLLVSSIMLPIYVALYVASFFWIFTLFLIFQYPQSSHFWGKNSAIRGLMGIVVLIPCWLALNFIKNSHQGFATLLFLFVLIWGADSAAYFVGKKWGKHKLAPKVSPGKTWEGLMGALVMTLVITWIALWISHLDFRFWLPALILSFLTVLFSVVGDLFESLLKRNAGLKDSGRLLPGHGGILDRIDSITAAAPIFAVGMIWIGKFYH